VVEKTTIDEEMLLIDTYKCEENFWNLSA